MTSIEVDIVNWASERPTWQRNLLKRIARNESIDDAYIQTCAESIVDETVTLEDPPLVVADLPTTVSGGACATLIEIAALHNVNALLEGESLTFGRTGVTLIYGDNGSGKSGYARLAKSVVAARHQESIRPNVYGVSGSQSAQIGYAVDGVETYGTWPDLTEAQLSQIHFFDEACGDHYLENETELSYRPSVLKVLDQLIQHVDAVRDKVQKMVNHNDVQQLVPPKLHEGTEAQAFWQGISAETTQEEIDTYLDLSSEATIALADLVKEEARLKTTEPIGERERLLLAASHIQQLADHLEAIHTALSPTAREQLFKQQAEAASLRQAADLASVSLFASEPIVGVGGDTWRNLWEAAAKFSTADAYPGEEFPAAGIDRHCVLCQQPLQSDAQERLSRFHKFVHDDVAQRAGAAETEVSAAKLHVASVEITTAATEAAISDLKALDSSLSDALITWLQVAAQVRDQFGRGLDGVRVDPKEPVDLAPADTGALRTLASEVAATANAIDEVAFKHSLAGVSKKRREAEARLTVSRAKDQVLAEVARLTLRARLQKALSAITTTQITAKSAALSREHVTPAVQKHFVREAGRLKLQHVVLGDLGGKKGKIRHKPTLLGASEHSPSEVLSEGEQTAAGLAGFFTEIEFDSTKSAVVLDDPMSSLDHERRECAARRIVEIARDRQVIVFTHDLVFLGEIVKASDEFSVTLTERAIERAGEQRPGRVINGHPWKAKDAGSRIGDLQTELHGIRKSLPALTNADYLRDTSEWSGKLSETWERIVRSEVAFKMVDRGTTEVRPKMFRVAAQITDRDNTEFQTGYGSTSKWARRHDKSEDTNFVAPTIDEMQAELDRIRDWRNRVTKYGSS